MARLPGWPADLKDVGEDVWSVVLPTIVETADQIGRLGELADSLAEVDPRAHLVRRMYDAITDWFFPGAREYL